MRIIAVLIGLLLLAGCGGKTLTAQVVADIPEEPAIEEPPAAAVEPIPEAPMLNTTLPEALPEDVPQEEDPLYRPQLLNGTTLRVRYPTDGLTLKGPLMSLSLRTENFNIGRMSTMNKSSDNQPGKGHFHIHFSWMNESDYYEMEDMSKTFRKLPEGNQTVTIVMVSNDHTALGLNRTISFTVPETGISEKQQQLYNA